MPNDLFQTELSKPFARKGTQVFGHIVLLPREDGDGLCAISQRLAAQVPQEDVYYVLPAPTGEGRSAWGPIINAVMHGNPPVMPKAVSYPHVTLLHIWMEVGEAEALLESFSRTAHQISIPEIHVDDWVASVQPRWRGEELLPATTDYGCSAVVAKTDQLIRAQDWATTLIPIGSNSRVVTGIGETWKPHFTLLALQGNHRPAFAAADHREMVIRDPILSVGLSGLYGQFKTALAIAGSDIEPTPICKSGPALQDILGRELG
jgi:hypothetical protein